LISSESLRYYKKKKQGKIFRENSSINIRVQMLYEFLHW
jgi:hypothetical protein